MICTIADLESSGGFVVRVLASHQRSPGLISRLGIIGRLSLLVLIYALRAFPLDTLVFPSPHLIKFDLYQFLFSVSPISVP